MATPLVAPAIANAVYQLTGARIRRTPMLPAQVKQALLDAERASWREIVSGGNQKSTCLVFSDSGVPEYRKIAVSML